MGRRAGGAHGALDGAGGGDIRPVAVPVACGGDIRSALAPPCLRRPAAPPQRPAPRRLVEVGRIEARVSLQRVSIGCAGGQGVAALVQGVPA